MNELKIFESEKFGKIRTIEEDGKILFCASDAAKALEYNNPPKAISAHCRYITKRYTPHPQNPEKQIEMLFIPEGDLYRLITHSKMEKAQEFESWVFDEVIPTIRKTGSYSVSETQIYPPKASSLSEVTGAAKFTCDIMKKQGYNANEVAKQARIIFKQFGVTLVDNFVKETPFEQMVLEEVIN